MRAASVAAMLGIQLLGLVWLPASLGGLVLLAGAPLTPLVFLPTFVLLLLMARLHAGGELPRLRWRVALGVHAVACALAGAALTSAAAILDTSWDGQAYHLEAVLALARGWNPIWHAPLRHHLVDFVPKSAWIVEALVALVTASPESAKAVHTLALAGAAALWCAAALALGLKKGWAAAVAALIAANPVAVNQILTFYVDGLVASSFSGLLAAALLWWMNGEVVYLPLLVVGGAFLATLKFSGLELAAVLAATLLLAVHRWQPRRLRPLLAAGAGGAVLALCLGVNPYLTNALRHGHPLHPLFGGREVTGIPLTFFRNARFLAEPPAFRLLRSVAARASNDSESMPRWKLPFVLDLEELAAFTDADTRIGGWGPLFSGCVVLSLLLVALSHRAPGAAACRQALALIWASALFVEQAFWARYAPQLWLAPALALLAGAGASGRAARGVSMLLALALALNVLLAGIPCLASQALRNVCERSQLAAMAFHGRSGPLPVRFSHFTSVRARLDAAGVAYRATEQLDCPEPAELVSSPVAYCLHHGGSPEPPPQPLDLLRRVVTR